MTKKISELNNVVTPALSDAFETAQSGAPDSRRITTSQIKDAIEPNLQLTPTQIDGTAIILSDTTDVLNQGANNWYLTEDGGTTDNLEMMPTIVDINNTIGTKVNRSGDTMTGFLILNNDPEANLGAATKQYVDNEILDVDLQAAYDNSLSKQIVFDPSSGLAFKDSDSNNVFLIEEDKITSFKNTVFIDGTNSVDFLNSANSSVLYEAISTTKVVKPFNKMTNSQFSGVSGIDESAMAWSTDYKLPLLYNGEEVQTILTGENVEVKGNLSRNFSNGVLTLTGLGGDVPDAAFSSVSKQDNIFLMNFLVVGTFYPIVLEQPLTEQHASDFENVFLTIGMTTTLLMRYLGDTTQAFVGGASFSIIGANPATTNYKYRVQIRRADGSLESTNFGGSINLVNSVVVVSFKFGFTLNKNDGIYFTFANTQNFNALTIRDFTAEIMSVAGSIPSTDGLPEGEDNFFLSTDGGATFKNLSGAAIVGNLPQFNTVGGEVIDSGIAANNLMLLTGDQDITGIKIFNDEVAFKNPDNDSVTSIFGSGFNIYTDESEGFGITCTGLNTIDEYTYFSQSAFFTYDDETESSSSYNLSILDRGVLNRVLNIAGANDVEGCRVSFGGDDPRKIDSFTINKPILHQAYEAALLEIVSTDQGVLLPRMTNSQMTVIDVSESPDGLLLYTADAPKGFKYWDDASWNIILSNQNVTGDITFTNDGVGTIANNAVNLTTKVSGVLPFANGGFGPLTSLVTGDLIVATGTNTPGKIADVATGQVLTSGGIGALPTYSSTPTLATVSLTSPANITSILGTYGLTSASSANSVQKNQFLSLSGQTITADQTYSFGTTTVINSFVSTDLLLFTIRPGDSCGGVNDISFAFYNGDFVVLSNIPVVNDRYVTNVALNTVASSVVITRTVGCGAGSPSPLTISVNGTNVEIVSSGTSGDYAILNNSKYTSVSLKNSGAFGGILASGLGGTPYNLNGILNYKAENSVNTLNARVPINLGAAQTQAVTGALNIRGANSSTATSANFYTTSDQHTVMQILPFAHANAYLSFDAYYDGAWKSSSAGSSFQIAKTTTLDFNYGVSAAGSPITWSTGFRLGSSGNVTVMSGDLLFNTASKTLTLKSGANGSTGSATFTAGSATISSTAAAANDLIDIMVTTPSNQGFYSVTVNPGSGYTVTSSNASDASSFKWKRIAVA